MYARMTTFRWDPASVSPELEPSEDQVLALLAGLPGFRQAFALTSAEEHGAGAYFSLWATREAADAVTEAIRERVEALIDASGVVLTAPPETTVFLVESAREGHPPGPPHR